MHVTMQCSATHKHIGILSLRASDSDPKIDTTHRAAASMGSAAPSAPAVHSRNNVPAAEIIESLPMATLLTVRHRQYGGFWQTEYTLKGMAAARKCFKPNPSGDIFLATLPKAGTTWLKALAFTTLNRATHPPSDSQHPLRHQNPHDCVSWLEQEITRELDVESDTTFLSSPRLFHTHLPYSQLPHGITAEGSRCRIVYVCRDPKDVLVSSWNFSFKLAEEISGVGGGLEFDAAGVHTSFEEAFELFCEGRSCGGPHWLHALEYWQESQRRPNEVLFLRYEDMLRDPAGNLKKLAAFMGCAFSQEEEEAGVAEHIIELCSLESLKSMPVNKNGRTMDNGVKNESFFRKGQVGDWKNYMTMEMAARLDKIVEEATRGSGLTFGSSDPSYVSV